MFKSLESLEKDNWGAIPTDESYLVTTCYSLRKSPLNKLNVENLRMLIGQNIGLKYLIPIALDILEQNVMAEGDFYEGDLLKSVLTSNPEYWKIEIEDYDKLLKIIANDIKLINQEASQYSTGREILKAYKKFQKL
tara:strand:- start:36 stop:443 length:408 start_codon:yes stop_codon:yes gene_type:complete